MSRQLELRHQPAMRLADHTQIEGDRVPVAIAPPDDTIELFNDLRFDLWPCPNSGKLQLQCKRECPGEARHRNAVFLDHDAIPVHEHRADSSSLAEAQAPFLILPECLDQVLVRWPHRDRAENDVIVESVVRAGALPCAPGNAACRQVGNTPAIATR